MEVDPAILRAFSVQVETASKSIADTHLGQTSTSSCDALPGSTSQYAARLIGDFIGKIVADHATNVSAMGDAVRLTGTRVAVQDDTLKADLDKVWGPH